MPSPTLIRPRSPMALLASVCITAIRDNNTRAIAKACAIASDRLTRAGTCNYDRHMAQTIVEVCEGDHALRYPVDSDSETERDATVSDLDEAMHCLVLLHNNDPEMHPIRRWIASDPPIGY